MTDDKTPPCRECGRTEWVAVWHPARPDETICMECCDQAEHADGETGHFFDRGSALAVSSCIYCGTERP